MIRAKTKEIATRLGVVLWWVLRGWCAEFGASSEADEEVMKSAAKTKAWPAAAMLALLAAAPVWAGDPVMSLQPLHPGRETVLEPAFEGDWILEDGINLKLSVSRAKNFLNDKPEDYYRLQLNLAKESDRLTFVAHLVRLNGAVFADIQETTDTGLVVLKPHIFARLRVDCAELHFDFLTEDFVAHALENRRTNMAHAKLDDTLVLTAPTSALQDFVESCTFEEDAFNETTVFTRLKEEPDAQR